eukprot:TRINITY_DN1691_c0_g1_i3.p1 TRINITY_DN1691_c0_g1~~TRINITY_DN1691_c0_g1_i3.p1  ORF type:complete len:322 (+),score=60.25 TRINITY_DN1691_c0_g1_i3:95-1060(+)
MDHGIQRTDPSLPTTQRESLSLDNPHTHTHITSHTITLLHGSENHSLSTDTHLNAHSHTSDAHKPNPMPLLSLPPTSPPTASLPPRRTVLPDLQAVPPSAIGKQPPSPGLRLRPLHPTARSHDGEIHGLAHGDIAPNETHRDSFHHDTIAVQPIDGNTDTGNAVDVPDALDQSMQSPSSARRVGTANTRANRHSSLPSFVDAAFAKINAQDIISKSSPSVNPIASSYPVRTSSSAGDLIGGIVQQVMDASAQQQEPFEEQSSFSKAAASSAASKRTRNEMRLKKHLLKWQGKEYLKQYESQHYAIHVSSHPKTTPIKNPNT